MLVRRLVQGDDAVRAFPGGDRGPPRDQRDRRDRLHGGGHDSRVGAVIPGQLHRAGAGEVGGEPAEDADVGAAEPVDGLVRVADRGQPGAVAADQPEQLVLGRVDVLVLVHADPRPAGAQPGRGVRVVAEDGGGQLDQAVEVHEVPFGQRLTQRRVCVGDQLAAVPPGPGHLGRDLQRGRLVGHLEPRGEPGRLVVLAQDPQAQAVERGHRGLAGGTQRRQPVLQFLGRAAGERDGQEGFGGQAAVGDLVGDPVGERAGLAAARPRDDQQRAVRGGRGPLVLVEPVQQRQTAGHRRSPEKEMD